MSGFGWLRRHKPCHVGTRTLGDWTIVEVKGRFIAGPAGKIFQDKVDEVLQSGTQRVVVDLCDALLADDSVATAAQEAYHKAKIAGADMRFVVPPGEAGGYYHLAGLEMMIPTYARLTGAIEI